MDGNYLQMVSGNQTLRRCTWLRRPGKGDRTGRTLQGQTHNMTPSDLEILNQLLDDFEQVFDPEVSLIWQARGKVHDHKMSMAYAMALLKRGRDADIERASRIVKQALTTPQRRRRLLLHRRRLFFPQSSTPIGPSLNTVSAFKR